MSPVASGAILRLSKVPTVAQWMRLNDSLLPGAHVAAILAAGVPYHRAIVNLEDAGFEVRDQIVWLCEDRNIPIGFARKPLQEATVAANVLRYGTGAINVDRGRIAIKGDRRNPCAADGTVHRSNKNTYGKHKHSPEGFDTTQGRFPANLIVTKTTGRMVDTQSGESKSSGGINSPFNGPNGIYGDYGSAPRANTGGLGDTGGASRYFKCCDDEQELIEYLKLLITPPDGYLLTLS